MENAQDYIDLLFSQPGAPDPPDSDITREDMIALIEANMEKYGITNSYMKNAMMGIILSEGGFKGVAEDMYYTTPGRLAEVWSTFSTYKNSKGQTIRAPKGQGSKYANALAKSGKYIKDPDALGNFIYGNRMGNDQPGDGYKYRGRGLNQLTGKGAYKSLGDKLGVDLVSNPNLLIQNPELQAELAVKFLADRINTTLPRLVKKNSKYAKRFPNLDYNNYTNQEDASYLLTSANAGFGNTLKTETINKRLAEAKKFNYHLNDRPAEELTANAILPAEEEINSVVNTQKEEEIVAPFDQWDEQESVYGTENIEKIQVPFDQEDIKYSPDNYENTIANANAETAPVNNLDAGEQERQKKFNLNLFKSLKLPQIHRGQSLFGQGNLFGANNKKRTGGSLNSRYFKNGGPGDGEDEDDKKTSSNAFSGGMGFLGAITNASKLMHARAASKIEVPEQGNVDNRTYFNSLTSPQKESLKYKSEMLGRDIGVEKGHTSMVQNNMGDLAEKLGKNAYGGKSMKSDYKELGIPFMGNPDSWVHKIVDQANPTQADGTPNYIDPYACQGVACAIGETAGAVNAQDYRSREGSTLKKKGAPWSTETGSRTVDKAAVLAGKGMYPVDDIQKGDMVRYGYNSQGGTSHNVIATGPSVLGEHAGDPINFPAGYASHWSDGVKYLDDWNFYPEDGDQSFRYLRNLPAIEKKSTAANEKYSDYLEYVEGNKIDKLPFHMPKSFSRQPTKTPFILKKQSYPDTRKGRKQEKQDLAQTQKKYATGGSLASPCSNGQIFDTKSGKCVSYETWEKNNSGFNMNDVKKENEDYFKANEWFKNYHNSPKYYEMTRGSYPEGGVGDIAAGILRARRKQNLKTIPPLQILPQDDPNTGGGSYSDTGQIEIYPDGFGVGTGTHEVSHSTDRPIYGTDQGQRMIPASDTKYVNKRKADVLGDSREYFNNKDYYNWLAANKPKEFKKQEKDFLDFSNYVAKDTETRARLNTIRQMAQEQGMYDPFTQKVSSDLYYKKLKKLQLKTKDRNKKGYNPMKQLQDTYSDEEIIWMLNNISKNETIKNNNDTEGMA